MDLTRYIADDLRHRIETGDCSDEVLTLSALSSHYGVSLTPVRAAVGELVSSGVLIKLPNGRLEIDPAGTNRAKTSERVTLPPSSEDWNRLILQEVAFASLHGDTVYLREEATAKKYGAGRSVIRQAFSRLAGAGLLEHVPRCGWLVSPLQPADLHAYLEIRESLELKALELARPKLEREVLERMMSDNTADDHADRLDNRLHEYWVEQSGNRYIQEFFRQPVSEYYKLLFDFAAPEAEVVSDMAAQHRQIIDAILRGDWSGARSVLSEHIWVQEHILVRLLNREESPGQEAVV